LLDTIENLRMLKKILNLEQKSIKEGIPDYRIFAIKAGCVLGSFDDTYPLEIQSDICKSNQFSC